MAALFGPGDRVTPWTPGLTGALPEDVGGQSVPGAFVQDFVMLFKELILGVSELGPLKNQPGDQR